MSYVIEYRGKIITNERGNKDYLRKRNIFPKSNTTWVVDDQGRKVKMALNRGLVELETNEHY